MFGDALQHGTFYGAEANQIVVIQLANSPLVFILTIFVLFCSSTLEFRAE